ncbi:glycosyltransferase family 2 protein [Clostridium sp. YIM B02555]|uniref:glycosyltransferase family 2 protein n=1 Tax=Clostridium sp. YIM B02555 TaxID=2911968 RepID=UPI001EED12C3|nr:glycosyltransferase family 2 protein [Clostridium sp. YIM B02555]
MKTISVIVPCYNEEKTIKIFYDTLNFILGSTLDYNFEIIFVNDGSKDKTIDEIKKLKEADDRIGIIDFSRNFGKEAALLAGLEVSKGEGVIVMDADLQDPPQLIPELIANWENGHDVVYTRRKNREGEPIIRSFLAKMFYKVINKVSSVEIVDGARDYRIMSRQIVDDLLCMKEKNRFSKGLFMWVGYNSKLIEFEHMERAAGETKWSFIKLFAYAIDGIVSFSNFPLRIASFMGTLISLLAFIFLFYILVKTMIFKNPVNGWASMTSIILFLGGIQLLVIGIIGEYLGRIFNEVKNRPAYFVKNYYESGSNSKRKVIKNEDWHNNISLCK